MKKNFMQWQMKLVSVMVLFCALAFFAGEAMAASQVLIWTGNSAKNDIVVTGKDINKADYLSARIRITYTNRKDTGQIVTAIFNKSFTFPGITILDPKDGLRWRNAPNAGRKGTFKWTSNKVNKVEVYPGTALTLSYDIPISRLAIPKGTWKELNQYLVKQKCKVAFGHNWVHKFQVRSERL